MIADSLQERRAQLERRQGGWRPATLSARLDKVQKFRLTEHAPAPSAP